MDRSIVYTGEIPRSYDFLFAQQAAMIALGNLAQAVVGSGPAVSGLNCAPTAPASLNVQVSPGQIFAQDQIDVDGYGIMPANTATVLKQGLINVVSTLAITPPSQQGYTQVYLVEAAYLDVDGAPLVLPYYDAANPTVGFSGPNNTGATQNTIRQGVCSLTLKAGAAVDGTGGSGAQAPAVDPGNVGLWLITVSNGQTAITSADIQPYPDAPFLPSQGITDMAATGQPNVFLLPQVAPPAEQGSQLVPASQAQSGSLNFAKDTGAANAYAIALTPTPAALTPGMMVGIQSVGNTNTGSATLAVNGLSTLPILLGKGTALIGGELVAGYGALLRLNYAGTAWELIWTGAGEFVPPATQNNAALQLGQIYGSQLSPTFDSVAVTGAISTPDATSSDNPVTLGQFQASTSSTGYQKLPSGIIIQFVAVNAVIGDAWPVDWPVAFPNALLGASAVSNGSGTYSYGLTNYSTTGATIYAGGGSGGAAADVFLIAIGF